MNLSRTLEPYVSRLVLIGLIGLIGPLPGSLARAQDKEAELPPTEILHLMFAEMARKPEAQRTTLTVPLMKRARTEGLSEEERFALGEVYFTNLQPVEAKAAFEPFMEGHDARASIAWERVMQILARAEGKIDEVEAMLPPYRERFSPSPENPYGISAQVANVANAYKSKGEHEKVVALVEAELATLRYDAPYRSFMLPAVFFESFAAVGKADEARAHLRETRAKLEAQLEALGSEPESADLTATPHVAGVFHRIEDHFNGSLLESNDPEALAPVRTQKLLEQLERRLAQAESKEGGAR